METKGHKNYRRSQQHPRWNPYIITPEGYKKTRVGKQHPLADPKGYAYEHRLVVASAYGLEYIQGKIIHHKNGNSLDNRLENLVITTSKEHGKIHAKGKLRNEKGQFKKDD